MDLTHGLQSTESTDVDPHNSFDVALDYGGKFDGVQLHDGAITSGLYAFTSASAVFTANDVGKYLMVHGAGASGAALITPISAYVSPTAVTTTAAAGTTVTGAETYYVTDDTTAWQNAINAAIDAANTVKGATAVITFPNGISGIAGALQDVTLSKAQLYLPNRGWDTNNKMVIKFQGNFAPNPTTASSDATSYTPAYGTVLLGLLNAGSGGALFRPAAPDYVFHRVLVIMDSLTVRMPPNPVLTGLDFSQTGVVVLNNLMVDAGQQKPNKVVQPTTSTSFGIKTPAINNNAHTHFGDNVTVVGFYNGVDINEHHTGDVAVWFCPYALVIQQMYHAANLGRALVVGCAHVFDFRGGISYLNVAQLNVEWHYHADNAESPTWRDPVNAINDASNFGKGDLSWHAVRAYVGVVSTFVKNGGTGLRCKQLDSGTVT